LPAVEKARHGFRSRRYDALSPESSTLPSPATKSASDISPAAVFLASDAANMVTGAEYEVTGGDSAKDISEHKELRAQAG
jgi:hypothetical protein